MADEKTTAGTKTAPAPKPAAPPPKPAGKAAAEEGSGEGGTERKGTKCPLTAAEFKEAAKPLTVKVGEQTVYLGVKDFSSKSFGWFGNEKITILVGETPVKVQLNINATVVGSKEAERE